MGKCPLDVLHSRAASLTAGRMDLNAPEGEGGEPYYFWPTERPHGHMDRAKAKHKDFALHLENRSSLSPAALTSHVSNCVGARRAEPVGAPLLFVIPHTPLSICPQSLFSFSRCLLTQPLAATMYSWFTTQSSLGWISLFLWRCKLRRGARCWYEGETTCWSFR